MDDQSTFGARLALAVAPLEEDNVSLAAIDRRAGLARGAVAQAIHGARVDGSPFAGAARNPQTKTLAALSRVLGVTFGWLGAGEKPAVAGDPEADVESLAGRAAIRAAWAASSEASGDGEDADATRAA